MVNQARNIDEDESSSFSSSSDVNEEDESSQLVDHPVEWPPKPKYDESTRELFHDLSMSSTKVIEEQPHLVSRTDSITRKTSLHVATESGCVTVVKKVLSLLNDEEKQKILDATDCEGFTALHRAIYGDKLEIVQLLLDAGSDVNLPCNNEIYTSYSPLHFAAFVSSPFIVSLLLNRGSHVNFLADGVLLSSLRHSLLHLTSTFSFCKGSNSVEHCM